MIPIIVIEGPTAAGKSQIANSLAEAFGTEIISADSRQIYRLMDIGTAKPTKEERAITTYHLIDIVNPDEEYSAGQFASDAAKIIKDLHTAGKIPLICGGTGFYIKALLEGLFEAPEIPVEIRADLEDLEEQKGTEYLYQMLQKVDPPSSERIHPNDSYRIKRALEIWIATGKGLGEHWQEQEKPDQTYKPFRIMVTEERSLLYERINNRIELMIKDGLIDEIRHLLTSGYKETDPGMSSVGYREYIPFIKENSSFLSCVEEAKKDTRNYAKRQFTWYRRINFDLIVRSSDLNLLDLTAKIKKILDGDGKALS